MSEIVAFIRRQYEQLESEKAHLSEEFLNREQQLKAGFEQMTLENE